MDPDMWAAFQQERHCHLVSVCSHCSIDVFLGARVKVLWSGHQFSQY